MGVVSVHSKSSLLLLPPHTFACSSTGPSHGLQFLQDTPAEQQSPPWEITAPPWCAPPLSPWSPQRPSNLLNCRAVSHIFSLICHCLCSTFCLFLNTFCQRHHRFGCWAQLWGNWSRLAPVVSSMGEPQPLLSEEIPTPWHPVQHWM